jgi:citrate synthase
MINVDQELLTAQQAADRLGIKLDTLYAYVSRGRLRSVAVPGTREKRYPAAAIAALQRRQGGEAPPAAEAGLPVTDAATLDQAAALLWHGDAGQLPPEIPAEPGLIERVQMRLAAAAAGDPAARDLALASVLRSGATILRVLRLAAAGPEAAAGRAHLGLAAGWGIDAAGAELLRLCLALSFEPQPDAASVVARTVAAAGGSPYAVVAAALAALSGSAGPAAAAALFQDLARSGAPAVAVMAQRLARGEALPGFGHPLHPEGDPRAATLLAALSASLPAAAGPVTAAADAGIRLTGQRPNLDFALAAAATALRLPADAALALSMIGRAVCWIALAIAQYQSAR